MSIGSAKSFIERINTDGEFAKRAMEQREKNRLSAFLKSEGYEFTADDYDAASQDFFSCELSDEQLDAVVGGGIVFMKAPICTK